MAKCKTPKRIEEERIEQQEAEAQYFLEQEVDAEEIKSRSEEWVNNNASKVLIFAGLIFLLAAVYFYATKVHMPNQEASAQSDMFMAQDYFAQDSFKLALNSPDGSYLGFLDVIDSYSGWTKASNLSHYYAGVSYLNLGEYENAITYLSQFSSSDQIFSSMAQGCLGDANSELGRMDEAIGYYKKAGSLNSNEFTAPMYFMKAGQLLEKQGKYAEAGKMYNQIKAGFPNSQEFQTIEKYISRVTAMQ